MSIEQDIGRIAAALERLVSWKMNPRQMLLERHDAPELPPPQPAEFVKPGPGPGRGHKKPKPPVVEENPIPEDTTAPAAEVPDTVPKTDTSPASPSEPAAEEPVKPEVPEVTLDDVRVALVAMSKTKSRDDVLEICKRFGATSGRDIPPEHYFDALMAFREGARA